MGRGWGGDGLENKKSFNDAPEHEHEHAWPDTVRYAGLPKKSCEKSIEPSSSVGTSDTCFATGVATRRGWQFCAGRGGGEGRGVQLVEITVRNDRKTIKQKK